MCSSDLDDRYRIAAAADGGIWLLRTPHPEPAAALAGSHRSADTSRRLLATASWGHQGSTRIRDQPAADPAIIRSLDTGQAAYIHRGTVTYIQIKRLIATPAAVTPAPAAPAAPGGPAGAQRRPPATAPPAGTDRAHRPPPLPDAGPLLDEAFGAEPG